MEMDMSEPGEMWFCCEKEHDLARTEIPLHLETRLSAAIGHIIISDRSIDQPG
jgi:hypothetical protein